MSQQGPPTEIEYPTGLWASRKDPFWYDAAQQYQARGEQEIIKIELIRRSPVLSTADKELLNKKMAEFSNCKAEYAMAVCNKEKEKARLLVKDLFLGISELYDARKNAETFCSLHIPSPDSMGDPACYETYILSASKADIILTSPTRVLPDSTPSMATEVVDSRILRWLQWESLGKRIHWLRGPAGCGKSTIMHRMALLCQETFKPCAEKPGWVVGISFGETFSDKEVLDHFLPTIISQIGEQFDNVGENLRQSMANWDCKTYFSSTPFDEQVHDVFLSLADIIPQQGKAPVIIFLDGLERCDPSALAMVFQFMEITIDALPTIRFVVAAPQVAVIQKFLSERTIAPMVDIHDVDISPDTA